MFETLVVLALIPLALGGAAIIGIAIWLLLPVAMMQGWAGLGWQSSCTTTPLCARTTSGRPWCRLLDSSGCRREPNRTYNYRIPAALPDAGPFVRRIVWRRVPSAHNSLAV